jgi:hypothetical protein
MQVHKQTHKYTETHVTVEARTVVVLPSPSLGAGAAACTSIVIANKKKKRALPGEQEVGESRKGETHDTKKTKPQ